MVCVSLHDEGELHRKAAIRGFGAWANHSWNPIFVFWFPGMEYVRCNTMRTEVALVGFPSHEGDRWLPSGRGQISQRALQISHSPALPSSAALIDRSRPFVFAFAKPKNTARRRPRWPLVSCEGKASARTLLQIPWVARDPTNQVPMIAGRCDPCCAQLICACLRGELWDFLTRLVVSFSPFPFSRTYGTHAWR